MGHLSSQLSMITDSPEGPQMTLLGDLHSPLEKDPCVGSSPLSPSGSSPDLSLLCVVFPEVSHTVSLGLSLGLWVGSAGLEIHCVVLEDCRRQRVVFILPRLRAKLSFDKGHIPYLWQWFL
jgi:hypothetical protein